MPSTTFFNLPAVKREKLLAAARQEFARVPYAQASINKIIRAAQIPRGSFYMYFADKEDLFSHILEGYIDRLMALMERLLEQAGGDLFGAFQLLYDRAWQDQPSGATEELRRILANNRGMEQGALLRSMRLEERIQRLTGLIDCSRLSLTRPEDLQDMLHILTAVTVPLLCREDLAQAGENGSEHYRAVLDILRRGMQEPAYAN